MRKILAALLVPLLLSACATSQTDLSKPVDMNKRATELKNLKWGMFICWSFSTFSEKEWTPGVKDVAFFKATEVDTDQWARTAKEAGMGYILFLTKHHDGFCLWDTKTTDRKVTKAPLGKDVLRLLRKSCDKYGIKLALYFSEGDWSWPGARDGQPGGSGQDAEKERAQLTELLTEYGPIEYLWVDHAAGTGGLSHAEFVALCKKLQPRCFVGFNHGDQGGCDIRLGELGHPAPLADPSGAGYGVHNAAGQKGYLLAEFTYPILPDHAGGAMWFYSLPRHDNLCKPAEAIYKDYLGAVKYGNIFSLDVGPDYRGRLRDIDVRTLRKVGEMIRNPHKSQPGASITASSEWGAGYEADKATDGNESTRWGAAGDTRNGWLEVDLGKDTKVGKAVVMETSYPRTQEFAIEYKDGNSWKPIVTGTTIAGKKTYEFEPVKARFVRLNIIKANDVPTIDEFQLFRGAEAGGKSGVVPIRIAACTGPSVEEKALPNGLTELRVVSDTGRDLAAYKINLMDHHQPATNDTGIIRQWEKYRYGAFFCFNDNQFTGKEFSTNKDPGLFNPSKLDINGWAKTMKRAGMKYAVLTTRHTSGFLLWDSATTEFDVGNSPGKPDVAGRFVKECRKAGIVPGFYYCLWGGSAWMPNPNAREIILAQLHELATKFGEIPYFWIDMGNWRPANLSVQEIYDSIKNAQPNAVVIMNQHVQDGQTIHYFPTDVVNGEVTVPPAQGHQANRQVGGKSHYLPFEFEPVSQRAPEHNGQCTGTPQGVVGLWFTYGEGRGFTPSKPIDTTVLLDWIKQAYEHGAANVLLSLAADHTGSMRAEDVKQLEELGKRLHEAGLLKAEAAK